MAYDLIKISALPAATPDESQEIVVGVGDLAKRINYGDVKADMVGTSPSYTTDTEPYLMRQTAHVGVVGKCALNKLIGGSLGWNQIVKNGNFSNGTNDWTLGLLTATVSSNVITLTTTGTQTAANINQTLSVPSGHKCFVSLSVNPSANNKIRYQLYDGSSFTGTTDITASASTWTAHQNIINCTLNAIQLYIRPNQNSVSGYSCQMKEVQIIDLTQMFGSTIADYVYSLETASSGSGIAWLSRYIDLSTYHAYDAGSIQSVQATAHVTTGFNQWDEVWEVGGINLKTGATETASRVRSKNYISVLSNTNYYFYIVGNSSTLNFRPFFYDGQKNYIGAGIWTNSATIQTTPDNCKYVKFHTSMSYGTTYNGDICINISKTAGTPKNGDYVPYNGHTYSLGSDTLRGIPQLVNNELSYDGDVKTADGTINRRYVMQTLDGSEAWTSPSASLVNDSYLFASQVLTVEAKAHPENTVANAIGSYMLPNSGDSVYGGNIGFNVSGKWVGIRISGVKTKAELQTYLAAHPLSIVYERAAYVTESSTPYQRIQTVDADGTESFTTSTPVPVGHETATPDNILAALEWIGE